MVADLANRLNIPPKVRGLKISNTHSPSLPALLFALTFLLPCFFTSPALAVNPESVGILETAPSAVDDAPTPMSEGFMKQEEEPSLPPGWRDKMKDLTPFLRDTSLNFHIRSFYFDRDRKEGKQSEVWVGPVEHPLCRGQLQPATDGRSGRLPVRSVHGPFDIFRDRGECDMLTHHGLSMWMRATGPVEKRQTFHPMAPQNRRLCGKVHVLLDQK